MGKLSFQRIWEENRKFLMKVGGGVLVFLVARSCVIGPYELRASGTIEENSRRTVAVKKLYGAVKDRYHREENLLQEYADIEKDLLQRYALALPTDFDFTKQGRAKEILFSQRIESIWGDVTPKARQINCKLPDKLTLRDLGMQPSDTEVDLRRHTLYLEILRRALSAMVASGMREIEKPRLQQEVEYFVRGNPEHRIVFQKIDFKVRGNYDAFVDVLRECQKPSAYLQAILLDMDPRKGGEADLLRGHIEFGGFFFEKLQPEGRAR